MSSSRPKRQITVPRKFSIEEGYTLPDSPERIEPQRVLRYLNTDDLSRTLQDLTVYVLWPEDNLWYEAVIQKPAGETEHAKLFYTDTSEEEVIDLNELVVEKQIAFCEERCPCIECSVVCLVETRSPGVALKEDELLADNLIHVVPEPSPSEVSDIDGGSSGHEGSTPSNDPLSDPMTHHRSHSSLHGWISSRSDGIQREGVVYGYEALNLQGAGLVSRSHTHSEDSGVGGFVGGMNGNPSKKLRPSSSLLLHASSSSKEYMPPLRLEVMTKLREKTIEQLKAVLKIGIEEASHQTQPESTTCEISEEQQQQPDPLDAVAKSIEVEIMKLCGGENNEYKNKLRTLYFNLKDARNPELRRRVLNGEIPPERLVSMSPKELASQELIAWRQKKKEEFLQATVLDEDAAAKFSTAAALKQLEAKREERLKGEPDSDVVLPATHDLPQLQDVEEEEEELYSEEEAISESLEGTPSPGERPELQASLTHEEQPPPNVAPTEDTVMDLEEIPDWAMEVVEAPPPPAQTAPLLYSPKAAEERNNSVFGPVPMRQTPPDLTPLLMKDDGSLVVGESVWQGEIGFAEQTPFKAQCISIAGKCDLKAVLTAPQIVVQGRMNLKKVEDFLEKLRTSKSRSVTVAILRPPADATEEDIAAIQENVHYYLSRERTGAMALGEAVEGYLIAKCTLTGRLLNAAQSLMEDTVRIPNDIDVNEFLLVVVHKKDWVSPKAQDAAVVEPAPPEAVVSDPRIRAGLKPVMQEVRESVEQSQPLPMGLTLESISTLAAMLGVEKSQSAQSAAPLIPPAMPPHQMTVPGAMPSTSLPAMEIPQQQPQQSAVMAQPERPKFLIFDPLTNKAVPLNPGSIQYDPGSNRVLMMGPLPQGFAVQQLPSSVMDTSAAPERLLANPQGLPMMMKAPQGESMTEAPPMEEPPAFPTSAGNLMPSAPLLPSIPQRTTKPMAQPMAQSRRGRSGFRRGRGRTGFSRPNTSAMQSFPESGDPL